MTEGYQPTKTTVKPIPPNTGSNVYMRMADRMYNLDNQFEQLKKKNEELEKENAELKMKIYGGGYEMIITKKDADIILLEKENTELKKKLEYWKSEYEKLFNEQ